MFIESLENRQLFSTPSLDMAITPNAIISTDVAPATPTNLKVTLVTKVVTVGGKKKNVSYARLTFIDTSKNESWFQIWVKTGRSNVPGIYNLITNTPYLGPTGSNWGTTTGVRTYDIPYVKNRSYMMRAIRLSPPAPKTDRNLFSNYTNAAYLA